MSYFLTFRARGEVAEMLMLAGPAPRLLVDISTEPLQDGAGPRRHTPRATFTLTDPELTRRFLAEVAAGDLIEAEGSFAQGDYLPHRTTCIDTTFTVAAFRRIGRPALSGLARPVTPIGDAPAPARAMAALLH